MMESSYVVKDCHGNRQSVVKAGNFNDLIRKGCSELGINLAEFSKLIYEDYGAEIINQECFSFLPPDSTFIILKNGEQWQKVDDEVHLNVKEALDVSCKDEEERDLHTLTAVLRKNHDCCEDFSPSELKEVYSCDTKYLASLLTTSEKVARSIQDDCRDKFDEIFDVLAKEEWDQVFEDARSKLETGALRVVMAGDEAKSGQDKTISFPSAVSTQADVSYEHTSKSLIIQGATETDESEGQTYELIWNRRRQILREAAKALEDGTIKVVRAEEEDLTSKVDEEEKQRKELEDRSQTKEEKLPHEKPVPTHAEEKIVDINIPLVALVICIPYCATKEIPLFDFSKYYKDYHQKIIETADAAKQSNFVTESELAWKICRKHPEHESFVPFKEFSLQHLPPRFQSEDVLDYIKAQALLTVRLRAWTYCGQVVCKTAFVCNVSRLDNGCICTECKAHGYTNRKWWCISLLSAEHWGAKDHGIENVKVDFFHHSRESARTDERKTLSAQRILIGQREVGTCIMQCATHDDELGEKLLSTTMQAQEIILKLEPKSSTEADTPCNKTTICISHPHGEPKTVTVGELKDEVGEKYEDPFTALSYSFLERQAAVKHHNYYYDTPTCRGSSGALVICLDHLVSNDLTERLSSYSIHDRYDPDRNLNCGIFAKCVSGKQFTDWCEETGFTSVSEVIKWLQEAPEGREAWINYKSPKLLAAVKETEKK